MKKRDIKIAGTALAIGMLTVVGVYEGKVRLTHAGEQVDISAGESAKADAQGVHNLNAAELAELEEALANRKRDNPTGEPSADVAALEKRVETLKAQQGKLKKDLKQAHTDLDAATSGKPPRDRNAFDLDQQDWRELAAKGDVKYRLPCWNRGGPGGWTPGPKTIEALGLAPDDVDAISEAYGNSQDRMRDVWRPLCMEAIGKADVVDAIGRETCIHLVLNMSKQDSEASEAAMRQVGEIRAGLQEMPGDDEDIHPVAELFLALTGEMEHFEAELAETFGPEEAKHIAYADEMCAGTSHFGGPGPRD